MSRAGTPEPVHLRLAAEPASIRVARRAVAALAAEVGADSEAVAVAVSETVTNAVVHGYRDGSKGSDEVLVDARLADGDVEITVADHGRGMRPNPDSPGLGFGLAMVTSLADEVEIESREAGTLLTMRFPAQTS